MSILDFKTVQYRNGRLYFLDQTKLPNEEVMVEAKTVEDVRAYLDGSPIRVLNG